MQPDQPTRTVNPVLVSIIVITLLAIAAGSVYAVTRSGSTASTPTGEATTTAPETSTATEATDTTSSEYTDGTYTETGAYSTPGGTEKITVTATLSKGVVTAASATGSATGGESAEYQQQLLSGYKSLVVGKPISDLRLSRVSGSSLTSNGFNAAIEKIKDDAKA